jgi:hypothetical protein
MSGKVKEHGRAGGTRMGPGALDLPDGFFQVEPGPQEVVDTRDDRCQVRFEGQRDRQLLVMDLACDTSPNGAVCILDLEIL